jgi:hypothetical protein
MRNSLISLLVLASLAILCPDTAASPGRTLVHVTTPEPVVAESVVCDPESEEAAPPPELPDAFLDETEAPAEYRRASVLAFGREKTSRALWLARAVAMQETRNCTVWPGTNNCGAIHLRELDADERLAFEAGELSPNDTTPGGVLRMDSRPTPRGMEPYPVWFATYPTRVAGIAAFERLLWHRVGAALEDAAATPETVARALYLVGYYEGKHPGARAVVDRSEPLTEAEQANVDDYAAALGRMR